MLDLPWRTETEKEFVRVADPKDMPSLLLSKFMEELGEFLTAESKEAALEEAADVLTALVGMLELDGSTLGELIAVYEKKLESRGAFEKGLVYDNQHTSMED